MNTRYKFAADTHPADPDDFRRLGAVGVICQQEVLGGLTALKSKVAREFGQRMAGYDQVLKAAVNEAEALAWQTPYPHLFFPLLAEEKAAKVRQWAAHQRELWAQPGREHPPTELAA
jgi:hypothetical protein